MAYRPEMHHDWQYPRSGSGSDVNWNAGVCRHPNHDPFQRNSRHLDDVRYLYDSPCRPNHLDQDESQYESHHCRGRHEVRQTPYPQVWQMNQPIRREKLHRERPGSLGGESTSGGGDDGSGEEKTIRQRKSTPPKTIAAEKTIEALVEEKFKRKVEEDKLRKASEREIEEKRLKQKEEAEEAEEKRLAELVKALADQREAIMKEVEDQKNAAKAELEHQAEAKKREQELRESTEAAVREAGRIAAEDMRRAEQEKVDADRMEEARWEAKAKQDVEILYNARMKKEVFDRQAAEQEMMEKQNAERIDEIVMLVGLLVVKNKPTERKETQPKTTPSKKTATRTTPSQKTSIQGTAAPKATSIAAGHNEKIVLALQKLVPQSREVVDFGDRPAFLKDEVDFGDEDETDSLHKVASGSAPGSHTALGQENEAKGPKEGKKVGKSNRKSKGNEQQEECNVKHEKKEKKKKKKTVTQNRSSKKGNSALRAMEWFAGKSYSTR